MGLFSKKSEQELRNEQKTKIFKELEAIYSDEIRPGSLGQQKACWLTSRAYHYISIGIKTGKFDEALEDLDEAIRYKSDHLPAHMQRALIYYVKGDIQKAKDLVRAMPKHGLLDGEVFETKEDILSDPSIPKELKDLDD